MKPNAKNVVSAYPASAGAESGEEGLQGLFPGSDQDSVGERARARRLLHNQKS